MKSIFFISSILFYVCITCFACKDDLPTACILNNTDSAIYSIFTWNQTNYDTTLIGIGDLVTNSYWEKTAPHSMQNKFNFSPSKSLFNNIGATTVHYFIFDAHTVENTPLDTIIKKYLILQRYDLTLEDFEALNWIIPYPPITKMKNMKMYPPFVK